MSENDQGDQKPSTPPAGGPPREMRLRPAMKEPSVAEGIYSNMASIMSGPAEFFLDFGRVVPGRAEFTVFSRIIMTPQHAKQLAAALAEHVRQFERTHGEIAGLPDDSARKLGLH